jgi:hypothetical protein
MNCDTNQRTDRSLRYVLVIPAYNEEEAIAGTLRRALAARRKVLAETPVSEMTVVVVNDGSHDRTQEIVEQAEFDEVVKVRFPENRGYGAAIKAGFRAAEGELVGFLDADGTCDPDFSVQLINRLLESDADVVLASRLNADSKMPLVRRIGNRIFAALLSSLARESVIDTASGFRVICRSSLKLMSPLPNGLHYTPAMSCICVLDPRLRIEEVPMPYEERVGDSKLSVTLDGIRFLYTILFTFCCYSPVKSTMAATLCLLFGASALIGLVAAVGGSRMLMASLCIAAALLSVLLVWSGLIVHQLNYLLIGPRRPVRTPERLLQRLLNYKGLMGMGAIVTLTGTLGFGALGVVAPSVSGFGGTVITGILTLFTATGVATLTGGLVTRAIWATGEKQRALVSEDYEPLGVMEITKPDAPADSPLVVSQG